MSKPFRRLSNSVVRLDLVDIDNLVGRMLTILDTISDPIQRNALHSLTKKELWAWASEWHHAAAKDQIQEIEDNAEPLVAGNYEYPLKNI